VEQIFPPIPAEVKYTLVEVISEQPDRTLCITDIFKVIRVGEVEKLFMGKALTVEFNAAERGLFGFSGCNTFRGSITILTETEIEFGNFDKYHDGLPTA